MYVRWIDILAVQPVAAVLAHHRAELAQAPVRERQGEMTVAREYRAREADSVFAWHPWIAVLPVDPIQHRMLSEIQFSRFEKHARHRVNRGNHKFACDRRRVFARLSRLASIALLPDRTAIAFFPAEADGAARPYFALWTALADLAVEPFLPRLASLASRATLALRSLWADRADWANLSPRSWLTWGTGLAWRPLHTLLADRTHRPISAIESVLAHDGLLLFDRRDPRHQRPHRRRDRARDQIR
jgi:hypothetical protein